MLLPLAACDGCARCRPDLPETDTDPVEQDTDPHVDPDTEAPPCEWPEVEPNDALDAAAPVPLEVLACGAIDPALDVDQWAFAVEAPLWLGVHVSSTSIGSRADVALLLTRDEADPVEARDREDGEQDVALVFPALPGAYRATILDEGLRGGPEDYFYELLVTEEKQPVEWTLASAGATEAAAAQVLADGDVVFGRLAAPGEAHWYRVPIPAGTGSVELWVEAATWGAPTDPLLQLYDASLTRFATISSGPSGERDPATEQPTAGDVTWTVRVSDQAGRGGSAYWYTLFVVLKGA